MTRIQNPVFFTDHFQIDADYFLDRGILDPILNVDTPLFIDPLLLENSQHEKMVNGYNSYFSFFEKLSKLLLASNRYNDIAWRSARGMIKSKEIPGTGLGFSANSTRGSAIGPKIKDQLLKNAKELIDLGIQDPDLFLLIGLFDEGIGPDRISDLTTMIILDDIYRFSKSIYDDLGLKTDRFYINKKRILAPPNPFDPKVPILLLPFDILRNLPVARDWSEISDVVLANEEIRDAINKALGQDWATKTKKKRKEILAVIRQNKSIIKMLLKALKEKKIKGYDFNKDIKGLILWHNYLNKSFNSSFESEFPLNPSREDVARFVSMVINEFKFLVEKRDLWKVLWVGDHHLEEAGVQKLFFAISHAFCKANNLDITPEADTGNGPVDFKFSSGFNSRVLVELKLSSNSRLISGYTNQLKIYKEAEEAPLGTYLVIDFGGKNFNSLMKTQVEHFNKTGAKSEIVFIDASKRLSASKR